MEAALPPISRPSIDGNVLENGSSNMHPVYVGTKEAACEVCAVAGVKCGRFRPCSRCVASDSSAVMRSCRAAVSHHFALSVFPSLPPPVTHNQQTHSYAHSVSAPASRRSAPLQLRSSLRSATAAAQQVPTSDLHSKPAPNSPLTWKRIYNEKRYRHYLARPIPTLFLNGYTDSGTPACPPTYPHTRTNKHMCPWDPVHNAAIDPQCSQSFWLRATLLVHYYAAHHDIYIQKYHPDLFDPSKHSPEASIPCPVCSIHMSSDSLNAHWIRQHVDRALGGSGATGQDLTLTPASTFLPSPPTDPAPCSSRGLRAMSLDDDDATSERSYATNSNVPLDNDNAHRSRKAVAPGGAHHLACDGDDLMVLQVLGGKWWPERDLEDEESDYGEDALEALMLPASLTGSTGMVRGAACGLGACVGECGGICSWWFEGGSLGSFGNVAMTPERGLADVMHNALNADASALKESKFEGLEDQAAALVPVSPPLDPARRLSGHTTTELATMGSAIAASVSLGLVSASLAPIPASVEPAMAAVFPSTKPAKQPLQASNLSQQQLQPLMKQKLVKSEYRCTSATMDLIPPQTLNPVLLDDEDTLLDSQKTDDEDSRSAAFGVRGSRKRKNSAASDASTNHTDYEDEGMPMERYLDQLQQEADRKRLRAALEGSRFVLAGTVNRGEHYPTELERMKSQELFVADNQNGASDVSQQLRLPPMSASFPISSFEAGTSSNDSNDIVPRHSSMNAVTPHFTPSASGGSGSNSSKSSNSTTPTEADSNTIHICSHCNRSFRTKGGLRAHEKLHDADSPTFDCCDCDKSFKRKQDLLRHHSLLHQSKDPDSLAVCEGCGFVFSRADALLRHKSKNKCRPLPGRTGAAAQL